MTKYWYYCEDCFSKIPEEKKLLPAIHLRMPICLRMRKCHSCGIMPDFGWKVPIGGIKEDVLRKCSICGFEARTIEDLKKFRPISKHYTRTGKQRFGVDPCCKKCHWQRDNRIKKMDNQKHPEKYRQRAKDFYEKNPEKVKASQIARKNLKPRERCEQCGSTENLNMHHPDYTRPEYVITLCASCHHKYHAGTLILSISEEKSGEP